MGVYKWHPDVETPADSTIIMHKIVLRKLIRLLDTGTLDSGYRYLWHFSGFLPQSAFSSSGRISMSAETIP